MIVIPMAGMSSRFFKAGYTQPKYMLEAHGITLFEHSVKSFEKYFNSLPFLFIIKDVFDTKKFVEEKVRALGIKEFYISVLNHDTRGQAETVALGLNQLANTRGNSEEPITIFNIDTFRPEFEFPDLIFNSDGYLEVFEGEGDNWSFAKPLKEGSTKVIETAEKNPISNLCSTGLYHFSNLKYFFLAYEEYLNKPKEDWDKGELYIAPIYNLLIDKGFNIHYNLIDRSDVIFCGVPSEYIEFLKSKDKD